MRNVKISYDSRNEGQNKLLIIIPTKNGLGETVMGKGGIWGEAVGGICSSQYSFYRRIILFWLLISKRDE